MNSTYTAIVDAYTHLEYENSEYYCRTFFKRPGYGMVVVQDLDVYDIDTWKYLSSRFSLYDSDFELGVSKACNNGRFDTVEYLMRNHGVTLDYDDVETCFQKGRPDIVKLSLELGRDEVDIEMAAEYGYLDIVQSSVEEQKEGVHRAASKAVWGGHVHVVEYLVEEHGADMKQSEYWLDDGPVVTIAASQGHLEMLQYLVEIGHDVHVDDDAPCREAIENGHLEVVKYLFSNSAVTVEEAVQRAVENGQTEVVKYFIDTYGTSIDEYNVLKGASGSGHLGLVKYLVGRVSEDCRKEALETAVEHGKLEVVKYFVEELRVSSAEDVLRSPIKYRDKEIFSYLLARSSWTELYEILLSEAQNGRVQHVRYLVEKRGVTDMNKLEEALEIAIKHGHSDVIRYFVRERNVNSDSDNALVKYLQNRKAKRTKRIVKTPAWVTQYIDDLDDEWIRLYK